MVKLSIGMMVKNEERNLQRTLDSLKDIRETISTELIIVDTGSTDATIDIAKRYTEQLYEHPWEDNFAKMRNIVLGYARGEWFMTLDADEVLEDSRDLIEFLKSAQADQYNSATLMFKNITSKDGGNFVVGPVLRLFRMHPSLKYVAAIHEQPIYRMPTRYLNAKVLHYGYVNDDPKLMEIKFERYVSLLKSELESEPNNVYYWYQLSKSYLMHKDKTEAVECAQKAYALAKKGHAQKAQMVYVYSGLLSALYNAMQFQELETYSKEAIEQFPDFPDFWFFAAKAMRKKKPVSGAISSYLEYLKYVADFDSTSAAHNIGISQNTLYKVNEMRYDLIELYVLDKEYDKAIKIYCELTDPLYQKKVCIAMPIIFVEAGGMQQLRNMYRLSEAENDHLAMMKMMQNIEKALVLVGNDRLNEVEGELAEGFGLYTIMIKARKMLAQGIEKGFELDALGNHIKPFQKLVPAIGEILYMVVKYDYDVFGSSVNLGFSNLEEGFKYAKAKYADFEDVSTGWLKHNTLKDNYEWLNWTSALLKVIIGQTEAEIEKQLPLFEQYVDLRKALIEKTYNMEMVQKQGISLFASSEEAFIYLYDQARKEKDISKERYISGIRKAVAIDSTYANFIEALINTMKSELGKKSEANNPAEELRKMKVKFKTEIRTMIEGNQLDQACSLIDAYGASFEEDDDILGMRGMIEFMKQDLQKALTYFNKALEINPKNADVLYNIAYIERELGNIRKALDHYEKLLSMATEKDLIEEISSEIRMCNQLLHT